MRSLCGLSLSEKRLSALRIQFAKANIGGTFDQYIHRQSLIARIVLTALVLVGAGLGAAASRLFHLPLAIAVASGALVLGLVGVVVCYLSVDIVLSLRVSLRKSNIDRTLPHCVPFMYALSRGGMELFSVFKEVSTRTYLFGETSTEFGRVVKSVELLGLSPLEALERLSETTPSIMLKDFVDNLVSLLKSGGSHTQYFRDVTEHYHEMVDNAQKSYVQMLGGLAETYITLFVLGPMFGLITFVVMSLTNAPLTMIYALIYLLMPLSTLGFIVLLDTLTEPYKDIAPPSRQVETHELRGIEIAPLLKGEEELLRQLEKHVQRANSMWRLKNLKRYFVDRPERTLYITFPAFLVALGILLVLRAPPYTLTDIVEFVDTPVALGVVGMMLPISVLFESKKRRTRKMEAKMPEFLRRLTSLNEVGLPLREAILGATESELGALTPLLRQMRNDLLLWGKTTSEALRRLEREIPSMMITRTMTLITKASESTSSIEEVLKIATSNFKLTHSLQTARRRETSIYVVVVYMAFLLFLLMVYVLLYYFLKEVPTSSEVVGGMSLGGAGQSQYRLLFYHATLIQGVCSGLVAGMMSEENLMSGIKHCILMLSIAIVAYSVII
ncbi:type II secretion system F family protein [Methermicoccus shengliensis]|uniref:Type II secretion system protein GspF domain-containing protein n=1 Tax=Methermicoccus shengliensis TaxID=660064 RepID=A0A832RWG7_9EURY|nr:type II secretion system F family protein [Methermicoccus shengliensis]KUK03935.1 MAG: Type II secretion system F domain protein [Euryarchaeota archaeon 55_53]HIH69626.1 hypothetical protein [Methermicoccus shengliensis]